MSATRFTVDKPLANAASGATKVKAKKKLSKLKFKLARINGHTSQYDAELSDRGVALAELFTAAVCFGEKAVPGLGEFLDEWILRSAGEESKT
jgi:hypothetical protein